MIAQTVKAKKGDYFLVTLLLVTSGNPAFINQPWSGIGYTVIASVLLFRYRNQLTKGLYNAILAYVSVFMVLFIVQYYTVGSSAIIYELGFVTKIYIGAVIFTLLGERFAVVFFDVMFWLCLISLPFFMLHTVYGNNVLSFMFVNEDWHTIGLYTFRPRTEEENYIRNSGMFWEPGAFQDYINIAIFLNFRRLSYLFRTRKIRLIIMFITFVSTQSTTGFLLFAIVIFIYLLFYAKMGKILKTLLAVVFLGIGIYLYTSLDILGEKIQRQYENADVGNKSQGGYNRSRFGSLLLDLHYIQKHPFVGNGFDPKTRYADDPAIAHMLETGKNPGFGNGFSDFLASVGIIGMVWYFFILYRRLSRKSVKDAIVLIIILVVSLQSEVWLRFPFFFGLPFLTPFFSKKNEEKASDPVDRFQSEGSYVTRPQIGL